MKIEDIRKGDIVTYKNGRINYVNRPYEYVIHYSNNFENTDLRWLYDITKIQRYVKVLWFYKLKTIYKRGKTDE